MHLNRTRTVLLGLLAALVAVLVIVPAASATTLLKVDVPDLTRTSQWIVRASVLSVGSVDLRKQGQAVFTDVELAITETYKGEAVPKRYTLRLPGGVTADGLTFLIPGMPRFTPGEDVVLFLERTSLGHIPCGLGQGVYRVQRGLGDTPWVTPTTVTAHVMTRSASGRLVEAAPPLITPAAPLSELVARVYDVMLFGTPR